MCAYKYICVCVFHTSNISPTPESRHCRANQHLSRGVGPCCPAFALQLEMSSISLNPNCVFHVFPFLWKTVEVFHILSILFCVPCSYFLCVSWFLAQGTGAVWADSSGPTSARSLGMVPFSKGSITRGICTYYMWIHLDGVDGVGPL